MTAVAQTAAKTALAKLHAAADAMRRRAEQAIKDFAKQQNDMYWNKGVKGSQYQEKGKGKRKAGTYDDSKKSKTKKWIAEVKDHTDDSWKE